MSHEPSVACVMLTADRQAMTDRAVRSFQRQSYRNKSLVILDSGSQPYSLPENVLGINYYRTPSTNFTGSDLWANPDHYKTVGALRNEANSKVDADIILHWDSDDVSYPDRIAEQVAALVELSEQRTGVQVIGSRDMWFWDSTRSEAWYYRNRFPYYCISATLAYWRDAWEFHRFPDVNRAESHAWIKAVQGGSMGFLARNWVVGEIHEGNRKWYDAARQPDSHGFELGDSKKAEQLESFME